METETLLGAETAAMPTGQESGQQTPETVNGQTNEQSTEQTTEGQTLLTGLQSGEASATKKEEAKQETPPEEYGDFKLPEGFSFDEESLKEFKHLAKGLNLPQDKAQKLIDEHLKFKQKETDILQQQYARQVASWAEEVRKDSEIGGLKFDENLGIAKKTLERFGTPELRELLNVSGYGNHPALVKFCWRVGKEIAEDAFVQGGGQTKAMDIGTMFFPNSK